MFDLTSIQYANENCYCAELVGKPLRLELNFTSPLDHVTELKVLGQTMFSVGVEMFGVVGKKSKIDNVSLQQILNHIQQLSCPYRGSFPSDYVPTLDNDTFAIISTQPCNMQAEQLIMIANSSQILCFADSLGRKK